MTKWEYLNVREEVAARTNDVQWMDKLGANGWECYAVDNGTAYFRRPKTQVHVDIGPSEHKAPSAGPSV